MWTILIFLSLIYHFIETPVLFEHTDNFRRNDADDWDTTPEYEFEAFGRRFHIVLNQDPQFMHPDLKVSCCVG